MINESAIERLCTAIADGQPVDWDAECVAADAEHDRLIVDQLQVLHAIGELSRKELSASMRVAAVDHLADSGSPTRHSGSWGRFQLLEPLGAGSSSVVFRAWDPRLARDIALKLISPEPVGATPPRILEEGRLLARIRHSGVVTVHGLDIEDGVVGIWMEIVRGRTLEQLLRDAGSFSAREAIWIGQELCSALGTVHAAGLIHGDIKAQNVMRESGGRLVLMDFGSSERRVSGA
jgi:serine/threonine-protein kinase